MRKQILLIIILFLALYSYGQNAELHYVKFLHVGENIQPVRTLNITYQEGNVPRDAVEAVADTLRAKSVVTDEKSFNAVVRYIKKTNFKLGRDAGKLYFGTFKIIEDGKYYYLPGMSITVYFKNLVLYLKKKKCDPQLISAIVDNYPWIFNP
ncbi:MAG TPA: hypothetical protein VIM16_18875 [Mucilaginibacter sp.]|jgi:hypothetical protein